MACLAMNALALPALAHDPVFGLGPHVLFKGGVEIAPQVHISKAGEREQTELGLELTYGLTGDWAAGVEIPYITRASTDNSSQANSSSGQGDLSLFSKYRFWREDGPGVQQSMSLAFKLKTDTGEREVSTGTTDAILGLSYGYEGRKWYRWAALRYRANSKNAGGLQRGDKVLLDLAGGIRMKKTGYREPDTVWILELNTESAQANRLDGASINNSGGSALFVSPGIFWTQRNFAIKAGVQITLLDSLTGNQPASDYRAKLVLEWHL